MVRMKKREGWRGWVGEKKKEIRKLDRRKEREASAFACLVMSGSATPWTIARQTPLSMGFLRQEHWSALPFPSLGDLPDPGLEHASLVSPALAGRLFTTSATWETLFHTRGQ